MARALAAWIRRHEVVLGVSLAGLGVLVTIVFGVLGLVQLPGSGPDRPAPNQSRNTPSAGPTASSGTPTPTPGTSTTIAGEPTGCVDPTSGAGRDCSDPQAAALVQGPDCQLPRIITTWGLQPDLDSLLLSATRTSTGQCVVAPAAQARQAGATALTVLEAQSGTVSPALRSCSRTGGQVGTSCASRHELEWVGDWQPERPGVKPGDACVESSSRYSGSSVRSGAGGLVATAYFARFGAATRFRCAVGADGVTLVGSVRNLHGAALPLAAP